MKSFTAFLLGGFSFSASGIYRRSDAVFTSGSRSSGHAAIHRAQGLATQPRARAQALSGVAQFPVEERFALASHLRQAVVSVPTHIAEGSKQRRPQDYAHLLDMAEASLAEVDYLALLTRDLDYLQDDTVQPLRSQAGEIAALLHTLRGKVEQVIP